MKLCQCENTVALYDFIEDNEHYYTIIMELCNGTLREKLDEKKKPFTIGEIYDIFSGLNNSFKIMHDNKISHRDLKLENILIKYKSKEEKEFIPKLCNFGFSKKIEEKSKNTQLGTPYTIAPEVIKSGGIYGAKSDLWSIGVMIYFCAFYEFVFTNDSVLKNILNTKKINIKRHKNLFLADLLSRLLEIDENKRISWEDYLIKKQNV